LYTGMTTDNFISIKLLQFKATTYQKALLVIP